MHVALVTAWGESPTYTEIPTPEQPPNTVPVTVKATSLHNVVRSRATGKHYSTSSLSPPHIPGVDGVGTLPDGTLVYFMLMPFTSFPTTGSFAETVFLPKRNILPLPAGADPIQIAGLANPAVSSWMALTARIDTSKLPENWTVLIMGATSASGRLAISLARALGSGRVIGVARDEAKLGTLGLEEIVVLKDVATETDFSKVGDVDVVLDYVYGAPTAHLLGSLVTTRPLQYVHIGSLAGLNIELPGSILRGRDITIRGAGMGSWKLEELKKELPRLLETLVGLEKQAVDVEKLQDVERIWSEKGKGERLVFTP